MTQLWIVGQTRTSDEESALEWDFQGVFSTEERAVAACRDSSYFVAPATLDKELPNDMLVWEGTYYPKASA
jgi:hypothetical protein